MSGNTPPRRWSVAGWGAAVGVVVLVGAIATGRDLAMGLLLAVVAGAVAALVEWRILTLGNRPRRKHRHADPD